MTSTINGVGKGDKFNYKKGIYEVTSVCHVVDVETGEIIDRKCYARGVDTLAKNVFEIPFATVSLNRIKN
jgi:hypothetical protein